MDAVGLAPGRHSNSTGVYNLVYFDNGFPWRQEMYENGNSKDSIEVVRRKVRAGIMRVADQFDLIAGDNIQDSDRNRMKAGAIIDAGLYANSSPVQTTDPASPITVGMTEDCAFPRETQTDARARIALGQGEAGRWRRKGDPL